jgi:hypothetical protein
LEYFLLFVNFSFCHAHDFPSHKLKQQRDGERKKRRGEERRGKKGEERRDGRRDNIHM